MNTMDMIARELLETGIKTTTKEAYSYAKFLKNYSKSLYNQIKK